MGRHKTKRICALKPSSVPLNMVRKCKQKPNGKQVPLQEELLRIETTRKQPVKPSLANPITGSYRDSPAILLCKNKLESKHPSLPMTRRTNNA